MTERHIQTPVIHRVVVHYGLVFVGGTVADDMSAGPEGQTEQILANSTNILQQSARIKPGCCQPLSS